MPTSMRLAGSGMGGEEAVVCSGRTVLSHDLAGVVDPPSDAIGPTGRVERGVAAPIQKETVLDAASSVSSHDLAGVVDPIGIGQSEPGGSSVV